MAKQELSYDAKTLIVLILLFVLYPVGLVLMFKWMNWKNWIKWLIAVPVLFIILGIILATTAGFFSAFNYKTQINKAVEKSIEDSNSAQTGLNCSKNCASQNLTIEKMQVCIENCLGETKEK